MPPPLPPLTPTLASLPASDAAATPHASPPRTRRSSSRSAPHPVHIPLPLPPVTPLALATGRSVYSSRPPSASLSRQAMADIHAALYAGHTRDRDSVLECVHRWYDTDAVFENPLTRSAGRQGIADHFALFVTCPGEVWSDVGDLCENEDYHGNRILLLSQTIHVSFMPAPDGRHGPLHATPFHSYPTTPYTFTPAPGTPHTHHESLPSHHHHHPTSMPAASSHPGLAALGLAALHPRRILARMCHFHLKILTRLEFNEQGRVTFHEDTWGVKDAIEGLVPLVGRLYYFERQVAGLVTSWLARGLFRESQQLFISTSTTPHSCVPCPIPPQPARSPSSSHHTCSSRRSRNGVVDSNEDGCIRCRGSTMLDEVTSERLREASQRKNWGRSSMGVFDMTNDSEGSDTEHNDTTPLYMVRKHGPTTTTTTSGDADSSGGGGDGRNSTTSEHAELSVAEGAYSD